MESYLINSGHRKALQKPAVSLSLAAVISFGAVSAIALDAHAARRPGAARTLRLSGTDPQRPGLPWQSDSAVDDSSLSQPVFGAGDGGKADLYFTRTSGGARNIWRTKMPIGQPPAKPANSEEGSERRANSGAMRDASLDAAPLTQLTAPYFAADAAPSPEGRWLLCATNYGLSAAAVAAGNSVIARLDINSGKLTALTDGSAIDSAPVVSPDGTQFAFVSERGGFPAVYLQSLRGGEATCVSTLARHPYWLDANTLIFESTRPARGGLYRVDLPAGGTSNAISKPQFLWKRAGTAAASHNGRWLGVSTSTADSKRGVAAPTRLYLLAPDGSGARAIGATDGARSLSFAPDDSAIVFDGPASEGGKNAAEKRTLWVLPMLRVPPTASLAEVRPQRGAKPASTGVIKPLDVYGTIYCEGGNAQQVSLEWGEGDEPNQWKKLDVDNEQANRGPLARWTPPAGEGLWTFRLTVVDADGDSNQSLLTVALPLEGAEQGSVPLFATQIPPLTPQLPEAIDKAPAIAAVPPAAPVSALPVANSQKKPPVATNNRLVQRLPLPALPPAPGDEPAAGATNPAPALRAPVAGAPVAGAPVVRAPESASDPAPQFVKPAAAKPQPKPQLAQAAKAKPIKRAKPRPTPVPRPTPPSGNPAPSTRRPGDAAVVTVTGVPISMTVGQTAQLEATLRNTGSNGWKVSGDAPVRLLIYWRDLATGRRTRWNIRWLRADVPPGGSTKLAFELLAPSRPGRFQLRFCLVRVEGGSYTPPPISVTTMPGEFGVASTTMDVD